LAPRPVRRRGSSRRRRSRRRHLADLKNLGVASGVASGVNAPLWTCSHIVDRFAQAGALSQQKKNTRHMKTRT
jgi:hypothetical protein